MSERNISDIVTVDTAFLLNLCFFLCGALIALTKLTGLLISCSAEIYFNASVLILLIDCIIAASVFGFVLFPVSSILVGALTAFEALKLIGLFRDSWNGSLLLTVVLLVAVPLHLLLSTFGFNNSIRLAAMQRLVRKTDRNFNFTIYYLIIFTAAVLTAAVMVKVLYIKI